MNIKKTANLLLNFTIKRLAEIFGILISLAGVMLFLALITYSPMIQILFFLKIQKLKT
jgi:S-DNA-T family DNA segregation ATPase FtsK/SpoIIIE